jgi:DnaJ-class molecular chaperone
MAAVELSTVKKIITCINCAGRGYVFYLAYDGMKHPKVCSGCDGTGQQKVHGT